MRARRAWLVLAMMAGLPFSAYAQSPAPEPAPLPVSLERVKRATVFDLPGRRPMFSVSVTETLAYDNPFGVEKVAGPNWADLISSKVPTGVAPVVALSAVTASMAGNGSMSAKPLLLMDALAIGTYVAGKIGRSLHARKVRKTRERVQQELDEFLRQRDADLGQ